MIGVYLRDAVRFIQRTCTVFHNLVEFEKLLHPATQSKVGSVEYINGTNHRNFTSGLFHTVS